MAMLVSSNHGKRPFCFRQEIYEQNILLSPHASRALNTTAVLNMHRHLLSRHEKSVSKVHHKRISKFQLKEENILVIRRL